MTTKPKPRCARDGCKRPVRDKRGPGRYDYCTYMCSVLSTEFDKAQRLCTSDAEAGHPAPLRSEMWATLVEINDAWTRYLRLVSRVCRRQNASPQFRGPGGSPLAPTTKTGR